MAASWLVIVSSVTMAAAAATLSQGGQDKTTEVAMADKQFNHALERSDVGELRKMIADKYIFTDPTGRVSHKAELIDGFASGHIRIKSQTTEDVEIVVYSDAAVETGLLTSAAVRDGRNTGGTFRFTRVWAKVGGRWQTVAFQETAPKGRPD